MAIRQQVNCKTCRLADLYGYMIFTFKIAFEFHASKFQVLLRILFNQSRENDTRENQTKEEFSMTIGKNLQHHFSQP